MAGKKGFGALFEYDSGGAVYVPLVNVTKMRPFSKKADVIDVSSLGSASETREKLAGMLDEGQVQFDCNYDPTAASHIWMKANVGGANMNFRLTMPSGVKAVITGFIQQVSPEIPFDNKMTCSTVVEISGPVPVFA